MSVIILYSTSDIDHETDTRNYVVYALIHSTVFGVQPFTTNINKSTKSSTSTMGIAIAQVVQ